MLSENERQKVIIHLERVVPVARDTFVDGKEDEIKPIVMPLVQCRHDFNQDGGVYQCGRQESEFLFIYMKERET